MAKQKRSCDACRQRKIQCVVADGEPACNWCAHHKTPCTFLRARGRRKAAKPPPPGSSKDLKDRVASLERALARHEVGGRVGASTDASTSHSPLSDNARSVSAAQTDGGGGGSVDQSGCPAYARDEQRDAALGKMYFAGQNLGDLCARNGVPFFSAEGRQWIFSVTGQWPCFESINFEDQDDHGASDDQAHPHHDLPGTGPAARVELPDRSLLERMLSQFLALDVVDVFPFVEEVLIHRTIQLAYQEGPQTSRSLNHINARACILTVFAIICAHFEATDTINLPNPDDYIKEAKQLLIWNATEGATLVTLETIVLLMMFEVPRGRLASAHMLHAAACRAVFALGGHRITPSTPKDRPLTIREREDLHLRDLFWLCYKLDKDIALRTGQPPLIADDFCNLSAHESYLDRCLDTPSAKSTSSPYGRRVPRLPGDLRLDMLKSKACKLLYSFESSQKSDAELLRAIRELDDELESWRVSLPAKFSPSLSVSSTSGLDVGHDIHVRMLHIDLHLQYHHLLAIIHCASGRCTAAAAPDTNGSVMGDPSAFGVQSSVELSVEASRSTLVYLKEMGRSIVSEAFWVFLCYPVSALMILFFNVLRRPLAEQAVRDVELLRSTIDLIRSMPMKRITAYDMRYLERIEGFISELGRLGDCAIKKARNEQLHG